MSLGATTSAPARGLRDRGAREQLERRVVVDRAVGAQHAAVAVARVLAQAHVGDDEQVGVRVLDRARGELDDALVVPGARALLVLVRRGCRTAARPGCRARAASPASSTARGDREPVDAGHRVDRRRGRRGRASTNIGRTKSPGASAVSRTRSRSTGVRAQAAQAGLRERHAYIEATDPRSGPTGRPHARPSPRRSGRRRRGPPRCRRSSGSAARGPRRRKPAFSATPRPSARCGG